MAYAGVPSKYTAKMDSCIQQVMDKDSDVSKDAAVAICRSRVVPSSERSADMFQSRPVQSPIRSIGDGRYRAYAVMFNTASEKDLYDTYFDSETRYYLDYYNKRPWLYDHGLHPNIGRSKVGDWDIAGVDDRGVFVEGELKRHHEYCNDIETLIDAGVLYPSSGATGHLVRIADDGHVEDWPINEVSTTVRPGDWRMLDNVSPAARTAMRSLLDNYILEVNQMGMKDELLELLGIRSDVDTDDEGNTEVEVGAEAEVGDEAEAEAEDDDGTNAKIVRSVVDIITTELSTIRRAIEALDGSIHAQQDVLTRHDELLSGMAQNETARTQRALIDGDWLGSLYVASRSDDAPEVDAKDVSSARQASDATGWELISGVVQ